MEKEIQVFLEQLEHHLKESQEQTQQLRITGKMLALRLNEYLTLKKEVEYNGSPLTIDVDEEAERQGDENE